MPSPSRHSAPPLEAPSDGGASIVPPLMQAAGGIMTLFALGSLVGDLWPTPADPLLPGGGPGISPAWGAILALSLLRSVIHATAGRRASRSAPGIGPMLAYARVGIALSIPVALLARAEFALGGKVTLAVAAGLAAWPAAVLLVAGGRLTGSGPRPLGPPRDRGLVGLGLLQQALVFIALPLWVAAVGGYVRSDGRVVPDAVVLIVAALFLARIGFGFAFGRALVALDARRIARSGRRYRVSGRAALAAGIASLTSIAWAMDEPRFAVEGTLSVISLHLWSEVIVNTVIRAQPAAGERGPSYARDAGLAAIGVILLAGGLGDLVCELGGIWAGDPGAAQARLPGQLGTWFTTSWNGLAGSAVTLAAAGALIRLPERFRWPVLLFIALEGAELVYDLWIVFGDAMGPDGLIWELVLARAGIATQTLGLSAALVALAVGGLAHAAHRRPAAPSAELARTFD